MSGPARDSGWGHNENGDDLHRGGRPETPMSRILDLDSGPNPSCLVMTDIPLVVVGCAFSAFPTEDFSFGLHEKLFDLRERIATEAGGVVGACNLFQRLDCLFAGNGFVTR